MLSNKGQFKIGFDKVRGFPRYSQGSDPES